MEHAGDFELTSWNSVIRRYNLSQLHKTPRHNALPGALLDVTVSNRNTGCDPDFLKALEAHTGMTALFTWAEVSFGQAPSEQCDFAI